ncbi:hypothetical protein BJ912DRAFT_928437 [Pholiota molesta]|nr:hypothetical protein BJ912DRAFT_928437 [Pholiota molesta]
MQNNQKSVTPSDVPDGYTIGIGPNGQHYIVPQFMVTALDNAFESYRVKSDLKVANFQGEGLPIANRMQDLIGEAKINTPPNPTKDLNNRERLTLHADIVALQEKLGISYKDAAHRLYIAELEKLKVHDLASKAFENLEKRIDSYIVSLEDKNM